jgi:hypothetical protein
MDDGLFEAEIAALSGFWQGRTLAAIHTKVGEVGASRAKQRQLCWHQDVTSLGFCGNSLGSVATAEPVQPGCKRRLVETSPV